MTRSCLLLLCLALAVPAAAAESALTVEALSRIVTRVPDHEATFLEERRQLLLKDPLVLSGTLRFRAPDRLEKHTLVPHREDLIVDGDWVTVSLPEQNLNARLKISDDPVLYALLFSLRALLNGDVAALEGRFFVEAWGDADSWTVRLRPRAGELADRVQTVRIAGSPGWIAKIEMWETTGDYLRMTINPRDRR